MKKKGVSLIFEQVMLFMISIMIFISCFSIFRSYEMYFTDSITAEQLEGVSELIVSNIMTFSQRVDTNSTIKMTVPVYVGKEHYSINLTQRGLNLTAIDSGKNVFSPLSSINQTFSLAGGFSTMHGNEFLIYKRGNQIIIG